MARRWRFRIGGSVQGVGFRPFVYRLAHEIGLTGFVGNDPRGVILEVEGDAEAIDRFATRLTSEAPDGSTIEELHREPCDSRDDAEFVIAASDLDGEPRAAVLPDLGICVDCARELDDPGDRRYRYPFLNCTRCGPRFSIVRSLPYDRARTTMRGFPMCDPCRREYDDPIDRRFHAQPTACPDCGPRLSLLDAAGALLATDDAALEAACDALRLGRILALKGLGGFQLIVDAGDEAAVARLRAGKPRRDKPFAVMVGDIDGADALCEISDREREALRSPAAPIVLLDRRPDAGVARAVAPDNPSLGLMLPYTPLHRLLLQRLGRPIVATSGNHSDEPICIDEREALERLGRVADQFLVHDRPIERHVDDSVARVIDGELRVLRRARGYAPRPLIVAESLPVILAVGGQLKNTIALGDGRRVFVSQHIGDLESPQAFAAFERVVDDFLELYDARPAAVAHDLHPDYATTGWALAAAAGAVERLRGARTIAVQHHHAHLASCLLEHGVDDETLGVSWDGTGHGSDGTIWGGEFLLGSASACRRVARLRPFALPGGDAAAREPRRVALSMLWGTLGAAAFDRDDLACVAAFDERERRLLRSMLERGVMTPSSSSMGRLFDAVASLCDLAQTTTFEGQAAMRLEQCAARAADGGGYRLAIDPGEGDLIDLDWRPLVGRVLDDLGRGVARERIAARFHAALIEAIVEVARLVGAPRVALSGGCFQNRRLVDGAVTRLRDGGFEPLLQREVPPNDGGLALGQIAVAAAALRDTASARREV